MASLPIADAPVRGHTTIYWDDYQVPFIEAEFDEDAAFCIGLVQAHLRMGLMEIGRRVGQGRLSEIAGEVARDVDVMVRTLDFYRAVPEIEASLPPATRRWVESFVAGINHYIANVEQLPHEFELLDFEREPWTVADVLMLTRLGGSDVHWALIKPLLKLRQREDFAEVLAWFIRSGSEAHTVLDSAVLDNPESALGGFRFGGSNCFAISGARSENGNALLAADPHVAFVAPPIWLMAGVKCPSLHAVGCMPVTMPFFALGRNPDAAWGGTNLYAASSSLYNVSDIDPALITERRETIRVGSREEEIIVRDTPYGPIISDLPALRDLGTDTIALRWMGHRPSDEITAMLAANRATSFESFREAFRGYAIAGMNMIYADAGGHVGQVQAVTLPNRPADGVATDIVQLPETMDPMWDELVDATTLPALYDPDIGYVASANNRPPAGDVRIGLVFSTDDRIDRLAQLMRRREKHRLEDLSAMQQDVYMATSVATRDLLYDAMKELGLTDDLPAEAQEMVRLMHNWNGHYHSYSRGALAYELVQREFCLLYYKPENRKEHSAFTDIVGIESLIREDLDTDRSEKMRKAMSGAIDAALSDWRRFDNWGDAHRLTAVHPFAVIPYIGDRYRYGRLPMSGGVQTLMKSGHNPLSTDFTPSHGATARFLSDLGDPDANFGAMVTGQDGWIGSENFLDQSDGFLRGQYLPMPLHVEAVRERAAWTHVLDPVAR